MVTHEITLSLTVTPARVRVVLALALCALFPRVSATQDTSYMDLYYPPASLAVSQLATAGATTLARDAGSVQIGAMNAVNSFVAVGPNPVAGYAGPNTVYTNGPVHLRVFGTLDVQGCLSLTNGVQNTGASVTLWKCKFQ